MTQTAVMAGPPTPAFANYKITVDEDFAVNVIDPKTF